MPAAAVSAGIGAAGSVAGGIASGKGAKKAAKIQAQAQREQMARLEAIYNRNASNFQGEINQGNTAQQRQLDMLGLGDPKFDATAVLRNTPGYQFRFSEGLKGVNTNAYASGLGLSGATLKALQRNGQNTADQTYQQYLANIGDIANRGTAAKGTLAGVSTNFANSANQVTQHGADNASDAAILKAQSFANMLKGVSGAAASAYGSSFGQPSASSGGNAIVTYGRGF